MRLSSSYTLHVKPTVVWNRSLPDVALPLSQNWEGAGFCIRAQADCGGRIRDHWRGEDLVLRTGGGSSGTAPWQRPQSVKPLRRGATVKICRSRPGTFLRARRCNMVLKAGSCASGTMPRCKRHVRRLVGPLRHCGGRSPTLYSLGAGPTRGRVSGGGRLGAIDIGLNQADNVAWCGRRTMSKTTEAHAAMSWV